MTDKRGARYDRAVLGAPVLPPGRVTRVVTRARAGVLHAHRSMVPPSLRLMESLFGIVDNRVLGLLGELDIPEHLDRPRTVADLAAATGCDAERLDRVLRYAAGRGFVGRDRRGRYRANRFTRVVRRDAVASWRGWIDFASSAWFWDAFRHAGAALRPDGRSGIEAATGLPFFEYVAAHPDAGRAFNEAMRAGATLQAVALAHAFDWRAVHSLCDVGGGTGGTLEHLLLVNPHLRGILYDLPEVVAGAQAGLRTGALASRCEVVGGSFFDGVPAGCDRYLLLAIVHDWSDDEATHILRNVAAAMGPDGRAIIVEGVLGERPRDDMVAATDVLMLVLASGRERTAAQFASLFAASGLRLEREVVLATGFSAFVVARA